MPNRQFIEELPVNFEKLEIRIPPGRFGEVSTICPKCGPHHRSRKKTLSANTGKGVFLCHRCGWAGRIDRPPNVVPIRPHIDKRKQRRDADNIRRIARECVLVSGSAIGRKYLFHRLGVDLERMPKLGFHQGLPYFDDGKKLGEFPALIATVRDVRGCIITLHRTYLETNGAGKADIPAAKKLMPAPEGRISGCAVRLYDADNEVILAEGIETALALHHALGKPAWATVSAHGLKTIRLPDHIRTVWIGADNDRKPPFAGQTAAAECKRRLEYEGRTAHILMPPRCGTDWLDEITGGGAA